MTKIGGLEGGARSVVSARRAFGMEWQRLVAAVTLIAVDWVTVFCSLALAWFGREMVLPALIPGLGHLYPLRTYVENLYFLLPWMAAFAEAGLYTRRSLFSEEARQSLRGCTLAALFAVFLSFAVRPSEELSRLVLGGMWFITLFAVPLARHNAKRLLVTAGLWGKRVLIIGAGETGLAVVSRIRAHPSLGYEPVAFADDDTAKIGGIAAGLPVRGPLSTIPEIVRQHRVKDVVLALPRVQREHLLHVISVCEGHVESIRLVPDMFGLATVGVEAEDLDGLLLLHMRWNLAKPWNLALKRTFDLSVSAVTMVLISPLLILMAVAIRLDSHGPVLFSHKRLGRGWALFHCFKFRTMFVDGESRLHEHLERDPAAQAQWEHYAKLKSGDPRVTRVGRILRRLSLDELPQLLNVLRGEMSLVGPRPYLPREVEQMGDFAETILKAPPGITGLWQVSGRNDLPFEQRLRLDEYYVRNWSLWTDVMVLVKTIGVVLHGRGAH